jgi:hypothetical protein
VVHGSSVAASCTDESSTGESCTDES